MQLNTLNRVIAIFLVGAFVLTVAVIVLGSRLGDIVEAHLEDAFGPSSSVVLAVCLLALTVFSGAVVDALGNLTIRRWIRHGFSRTKSSASWFFCAPEFDAKNKWRKIFLDEIARHPTYRDFTERDDDLVMALSAGLFFRTAEKEHSEWLIQHHSMYHLAANFVVVGIIGALWCIGACAWFAAAIAIAISYLLTTFALDNHLYTYQLSFRNAYLALSERRDSKASG